MVAEAATSQALDSAFIAGRPLICAGVSTSRPGGVRDRYRIGPRPGQTDRVAARDPCSLDADKVGRSGERGALASPSVRSPFPIANFRHILAVLSYMPLVIDEFVADELGQIGAA